MVSPTMKYILSLLSFFVFLHRADTQANNTKASQRTEECGILAAFPFGDGRSLNGVVGLSNETTIFKRQNLARDGYGLMAAALLAIDHFNSRNDTIVRELNSIRNCLFQFQENSLQVIDCNRSPSKIFQELLLVKEEPCVIIGPYDDDTAQVMQLVLLSAYIPGITFGARSPAVASAPAYPQMVRGTIELISYTTAVASYLQRRGKERDYLATLVTGGIGFELANALDVSAKAVGLKVVERLSIDPNSISTPQGISKALEEIKESGVRTIVVGIVRDDDLEKLANTAHILGLLSNEYLWVFLDQTLPPEYITEYDLDLGSPLSRLLQGSAIIKLLDGFEWNSEDRFLTEWKNLNGSFVDRVDKLYPNRSAVQFRGSSNFFRTERPPTASTFVYDSIISAGLGKCQAGARAVDAEGYSNATDRWIRNILRASFIGASGRVAYNYNSTRSRNPEGVGFGVFNIRPKALHTSAASRVQFEAVLTDIMVEEEWTTTGEPFLFRDGTSKQPTPTRLITENNYLPWSIRAAGLFFMVIAQILTIACALFVWINRKQRVLTASQPAFLYLLCAGSFLFSSSILTRSFDEGLGLNQSQLDALCMTTPWLIFVGDSIIYMALFSKLWRVQKVLQFRRAQKVNIMHVIGPFVFCEISVFAIMATWQFTSPMRWTRVTIEGNPPQTIGNCKSNREAGFMSTLSGIIFVITLLAAWMSWKTRDAPADISDSSRVWYTILTHLQSIVVGVPLLYILNGKSPNAMYLCFALLVSTIAITSMSFLIVSKMCILLEERVRGDSGSHRRTVRISGFGGGSCDAQHHLTTTSAAGNAESQLRAINEKIRLLEIQRDHISSTMQSQASIGGRGKVPLRSCKTASWSVDEALSIDSNSSGDLLSTVPEGREDNDSREIMETPETESCIK